MLFSLTSSTKKYTCEVCSETPETFLTSIVAGICNATDTKERVIADNRVDVLEHKVNKIMVSLEKFDLQTVTDNLSMLGNKMEQANNNLTGNVKAMQKMKKDQEDSTTEFTTRKEHTHSDNELEQVLQAFTRDLNKMDMDEMNQKIAGLVSKAVTKADKVVLSTIIRREDVEDIDLKADVVNAFMQLKYKRNENVVVCDNYKLYDSQFRKGDKLHLNDDGTPIFASNLKYAIAEACGVRVIQKRRDFEYRYDDNDRRSGGRGSFRGRR